MPQTITLDDKYEADQGRIFISGTQALVRLLLVQKRRDVAAGLDTAGFISGYRGSPLGGLDAALWRAGAQLKAHRIHFRPGVNEDLAATSVWGTQQVNSFPGARHDGVFAAWYGKGPGVDRSGDALKHGNFAGSAKNGGVLVFCGDDHGARSSTTAHQSEQALIAAMIPVFNPAGVQDYLDLGIYGWALSRFSGLWAGFKCIGETVESSVSCDADMARVTIVLPDDIEIPQGGLNIRLGAIRPLEQEEMVVRHRLPAAQAFVRANRLDRTVIGGAESGRRRLGIVSAGKACLDVRQALSQLGLDAERAAGLGISLRKLALTWPIEPEGMRAFAETCDEVLVIEEKRPVIEEQIASLLYNLPTDRRPRLLGKRDDAGAPLVASHGEIGPLTVAAIIGARLRKAGALEGDIAARLERLSSADRAPGRQGAEVIRLPYFCAGCPHNTSTRVPEGSLALAGIGCHTMAMWMPGRSTAPPTQMGGEGANWIGMAPFTEMGHIFQNLGDGTYFHSGLIAIRAAIASGANITYKILYNDAVAMTGGQPLDGSLSVAEITRQVEAEGVSRIVVVTDEPGKYGPRKGFASGVSVYPREALDRVQKDLRQTPGTSILIYDQTCAAEKRRRRKRGLFPDPPRRVFINEAVCEGCGDCSEVSNCVAIEPVETAYGRKRQINQSSCNKDFSCLKGFCPSFVTVEGGRLRQGQSGSGPAPSLPALAEPVPLSPAAPYNILLAGIGGTGVVTVGALLAMAAHIDGRGCSVQDMTGLAQKNGAVLSHVRIAARPDDLQALRIGAGEADLVIGCDLIVAGGAEAMATLSPERSRAVVDRHLTPTAEFQSNPDADFHGAEIEQQLAAALSPGASHFIDASEAAMGLSGEAAASNILLLGFALQKGLLPVSLAALHQAIRLNGVAVDDNLRLLDWGRALETGDAPVALSPSAVDRKAPSVDDLVAGRESELVAYQDAALAARYRRLVERVRGAEAALGDGEALALAVAHGFFRLLALKDEYEVARLFTDGAFMARLEARFEGNFKLKFHLSPPIFARLDPATGRPLKKTYGPWMWGALRLLAALRGLRGGAFDIFGRTAERQRERALADAYEKTVDRLLAGLNADNLAIAVEIAALADHIRGYGPVRQKTMDAAAKKEARLLARFGKSVQPAAA